MKGPLPDKICGVRRGKWGESYVTAQHQLAKQ